MRKHLFTTLGFCFLVLGLIGVFLPIMPTVPFIIMAAGCFHHGSQKWRHWLLKQPAFGPALRDWEEQRAIRPRVKAIASLMITVSFSFVLITRDFALPLKITMASVGLLVVGFILTRNSGRKR